LTTKPTIADVMAAIQGIETRLGARLDQIETRLDARLDKIEARLDKIETRLDALEARVEEIDEWRKTQPDLRLMLVNSKLTHDKIIEMEGEIRMLRSAINDHARENVTPGEMAAVHHDLSALQRDQLENAGRLLRIEEVLHLTAP